MPEVEFNTIQLKRITDRDQLPRLVRSSIDMKEVNELVRDLLEPKSHIYWPDLLLSALIGWSSFALFVSGHILFGVISVFAIFRCLFFIHELTHIAKNELPGFRYFWNVLIGYAVMAPSVIYENVHLDHHRRTKYGTPGDPEYLPLGRGARLGLILFILKAFVIPPVLAVRFLLLSPVGWVIPRFHRWLEINVSAILINEKYRRRTLTDEERRTLYRDEFSIFALFSIVAVSIQIGLLPMHIIFDWYLVLCGIGLVNQTRTVVAHRYMNLDGDMEYEDQLLDSVNVEGGALTELWAPVGARFHALHHYVPKIPYHALPEAHLRMKARFSKRGDIYPQVNERNFISAWGRIWRTTGKNVFLAFVFTLGSSLFFSIPSEAAQTGDACLTAVQVRYPSAKTIRETQMGEVFPIPNDSRFGRFFVSTQNKRNLGIWTIPFAGGKACVVREVVQIPRHSEELKVLN